MLFLNTYFRSLGATVRHEERGAGMVEYGLLVALIALVVALAAAFLGDQIANLFNDAGNELVTP